MVPIHIGAFSGLTRRNPRCRKFWLRPENIASNLGTERLLAPQNRRGRTVDGRDVSAGRELFIKNLGRGRLDHGKASGERGCVCFRRHNKNAPPLMASQSGAHAEIVATSGWQLTGTSVYARRIVGKRCATSEEP